MPMAPLEQTPEAQDSRTCAQPPFAPNTPGAKPRSPREAERRQEPAQRSAGGGREAATSRLRAAGHPPARRPASRPRRPAAQPPQGLGRIARAAWPRRAKAGANTLPAEGAALGGAGTSPHLGNDAHPLRHTLAHAGQPLRGPHALLAPSCPPPCPRWRAPKAVGEGNGRGWGGREAGSRYLRSCPGCGSRGSAAKRWGIFGPASPSPPGRQEVV